MSRLLKWQGNIFEDRHRVKESIILKHVTDLTEGPIPLALAHFLNRLPTKQDDAFIGCQQPDHVFEQNALAAATLPNDGGDLSLIDRQVNLIEDHMVVETIAHFLEFNQWIFHRSLQKKRRDDIVCNEDEHARHDHRRRGGKPHGLRTVAIPSQMGVVTLKAADH